MQATQTQNHSLSTYKSRYNRLHWLSGVLITAFALVHILNHVSSIMGIAFYTSFMETARIVYRNPVIETLLLASVLMQIITGIGLVRQVRKKSGFFEKARVYSGLYLAFFLLAHTTAIVVYKHVVKLDTNFYFAALAFNVFPGTVTFVPYYLLGVNAVFIHLACTHYFKMQVYTSAAMARRQARLIILTGIVVSLLITYGYTGNLKGVAFPQVYKDLVK